MVMAQSLFISLKQKNPDCLIDVFAPAWSIGLLARMPEVNKAIENPFLHGDFNFKARFFLGKQLTKEKYDLAIVLPHSWKSALIPFFANIPKRLGYIGEFRIGLLNEFRKLNKTVLTQTVQRFVALGSSVSSTIPICPQPKLQIDNTNQQKLIEKFHLDLSKPILAICAGAEYGESKRWSPDFYAQVADYFLKHHGQVWLFGSNKDVEISERINAKTHHACFDLTGKTTLVDAIDLLDFVQIVLSNDSGLMHVASALDKKIIAIYGSTLPDFAPPLTQNGTIVSVNLPCKPCFKRQCPFEHTRCLNDITPDKIIQFL